MSDTVNSTRVGSDGTELGVQILSEIDGTTAVTNEVGGHKPSIADGAANTGETLDSTNYKLSGGAAVQSLASGHNGGC